MTGAEVRSLARRLFAAAVGAVEPSVLVRERVERDGEHTIIRIAPGDEIRWPLPLHVVAAGKPAARMLAGCIAALGADAVRGIALTADGCAVPAPGSDVYEAGHPLPDERGLAATQAIVAHARNAAGGLLCLLGGGASSLLVWPRPPVTLADKLAATRLLLACGADITELNTVRKHLSLVKGGGLLRVAPGAVVTLALSDVVGDDLGVIASGPTVADPTTFADAWAVFQRYGITSRAPSSVVEVLEAGRRGELAESVKPGDAAARRSRAAVIGHNRTALRAAAAVAAADGWHVEIVESPLTGDTTAAARRFAALLRAARGRRRCILVGGETTVVVRGTGRGGRNQEFALVLAGELAGRDWTVLSAGTDGIDGPTAAAGAFVDGATEERARGLGLDIDAALADNDSHSFFAALSDLFTPGPTGTNVTDIKVALHPGEVDS